MFKENTRNVSREWQQPQVENDVNNVPFTVERSDMRRGHGCDDEDDPLLQIAIAESTNINRQQNTTQMDIDMSSTNSSHLNNYSVSDLTEEEQLALALSLSTQDFEAKQRTDE
jgi:outer membrane lipoprotein-sorting protein